MLNRLQGHSAFGGNKSMENLNDTIGNRTRSLPACSAVRQQTAPLWNWQVVQHVIVNKTSIIHQSIPQAAPNVSRDGKYSESSVYFWNLQHATKGGSLPYQVVGIAASWQVVWIINLARWFSVGLQTALLRLGRFEEFINWQIMVDVHRNCFINNFFSRNNFTMKFLQVFCYK